MIVFARLIEAYGLQGWLKVHFFADDVPALGRVKKWWLASEVDRQAASWQACDLQSLKPHGKGWIVKLAGIQDRTGAESLLGCYVAAPRDALPAPAAGEYYWADLIGLDVVNTAGVVLGKVTQLLESGAHDVLCVRAADGQERLLPFVSAIVQDVDPGQALVRVAWEADW